MFHGVCCKEWDLSSGRKNRLYWTVLDKRWVWWWFEWRPKLITWKPVHTRCDQKLPRLIFHSAVGTLRDTQGQTVKNSFIYKFWSVWDLLFLARGHRYWRRGPGRYITTRHQHTQHIPSSVFGKSWHSCRSATTLLPWHGSVWLLVVPANKNSVEREEIWRHRRNSEECDEYAAHHYKILFQKMFHAVAGRWKYCVSSQGEYFENY
jgi:hypothetical protein